MVYLIRKYILRYRSLTKDNLHVVLGEICRISAPVSRIYFNFSVEGDCLTEKEDFPDDDHPVFLIMDPFINWGVWILVNLLETVSIIKSWSHQSTWVFKKKAFPKDRVLMAWVRKFGLKVVPKKKWMFLGHENTDYIELGNGAGTLFT